MSAVHTALRIITRCNAACLRPTQQIWTSGLSRSAGVQFMPVRHAGHSKWAKIHRAKGANDAARGQLFTKIGKQIQAAVRAGGTDPTSNLALAAALDSAKKNNVPKDNIERALKGKDGVVMQSMSYEAVGPGGVAFIIEALTDNKTRAAGNIRSYFAKAGGELQASGAVAWMFAERGRVEVSLPSGVAPGSAAAEDFEGKLLDAAAAAGAEDVEMPEAPEEGEASAAEGETGPLASVWCSKDTVQSVRSALAAAGFDCVSGTAEKVPTTRQALSDNAEEAFSNLLAKLDRDEDVQGYVHNAE